MKFQSKYVVNKDQNCEFKRKKLNMKNILKSTYGIKILITVIISNNLHLLMSNNPLT